ncbi:hypothetical protein [Mycoplasma hafezii]|uniref:hypothetical protein n=1 Tax=Mycoplasma hafezii TaxID=525886 RepID=UPI003CE84A21
MKTKFKNLVIGAGLTVAALPGMSASVGLMATSAPIHPENRMELPEAFQNNWIGSSLEEIEQEAQAKLLVLKGNPFNSATVTSFSNYINGLKTPEEVKSVFNSIVKWAWMVMELKEYIYEEEEFKENSKYYKEATEEQKEKFDKSLEEAKKFIADNYSNNNESQYPPVLGSQTIENFIYTVHTKKVEDIYFDLLGATNPMLPEDQRVTAKNIAIKALNKWTTLSMQEKQPFIQKLQALQDTDTFAQTTPILEDAFQSAIQSVKKQINGLANLGQTQKTTYDTSAAQKNLTEDFLDTNLAGVIQDAITFNGKLQPLRDLAQNINFNEKQKQGFNEKIDELTPSSDTQDLQSQMQNVQLSMQQLRTALQNNNIDTIKESAAYKLATNKADFDAAATKVQGIENGTVQNFDLMNSTDIDNAVKEFTNAIAALNGKSVFEQYQNDKIADVQKLTNLSTAAQQTFIDAIKKATTTAAVDDQVTNATALNTEAGKLIQELKNYTTQKANQKYTHASGALKQAFDTQYNDAEAALGNTAENPNVNKLVAGKTVADITKMLDDLSTAFSALDGDTFGQKQTEATQAINNLGSLSPEAKKKYLDQIKDATSIDQLAQPVKEATELNKDAESLINKINSYNEALKSDDFKNATEASQKAFTDAIKAAQDLLNKDNLLNPNVTSDQIMQAIGNMANAKAGLTGQPLEDVRKGANTTIDGLKDLTPAQKEAIKDKITASENAKDIEKLVNDAKALDVAMNTLNNAIKKANAAKNSPSYTYATKDNQAAFDKALTPATAIANQPKKDVVVDPAAITTITKNLIDATNALNGMKNKLTETVNNSQILTKEQKQEVLKGFKDKDLVTSEEANTILDNAMKLSKEDAIKKLAEYKNLTKTQVEDLTKKINEAKYVLTNNKEAFDQNVSDILNTANVLNNNKVDVNQKFPNLSNKEKTEVINQLNNAKTPEQVDQIIKNAEALNDAIDRFNKDLKDYLTTGDATKVEKDLADIKAHAIKDKNNQYVTPVNSYENLLEAAKALVALNNAGTAYANGSFTDKDYATKLEALKSALKNAKDTIYGVSDLGFDNANKEAVRTELQEKMDYYDQLVNLVGAIADTNKLSAQITFDKFELVSKQPWIKLLKTTLEDDKYFDLVNSSSATAKQIAKIKTDIEKLENTPTVVTSALLSNVKEVAQSKSNLLWLLLLIPGVALLVAGGYFGYKKFAKKDK